MKAVKRAQWLARFDLEPLASATMRNGMLIGVGFIIASVISQWVQQISDLDLGYNPHAPDLQILLLGDLRRYGPSRLWARPLVDAGITVILATPYLRLLISFGYFLWVERRWPQAVFTAIILIILTLILFTSIV